MGECIFFGLNCQNWGLRTPESCYNSHLTILRFLAAFSAIVAGCASIGLAQVPAFPGALGFGANATGGRTDMVYHVTKLNDSGAGSFRDAVSSGNRTVVFDVGGYISLATAVSVKSSITIA